MLPPFNYVTDAIDAARETIVQQHGTPLRQLQRSVHRMRPAIELHSPAPSEKGQLGQIKRIMWNRPSGSLPHNVIRQEHAARGNMRAGKAGMALHEAARQTGGDRSIMLEHPLDHAPGYPSWWRRVLRKKLR